MDCGSGSGRYNLHNRQRSAGNGVGQNNFHQFHLHGKQEQGQGHVTSSSVRDSRNSRFEEETKYCFTSRDLLESNECKPKQRIPKNLQENSSEIRTAKEQASSSILQVQSPPIYFPSKETVCPVCYPPLGGYNIAETNYTMGNKSSSSKTCTCKVEDQKPDHKKSARPNQNVKKSRKSKNFNPDESKEKPVKDESLPDVFQNLKISSQEDEVPRHVLYYAWFLDPDVSLSLKTIAHNYFTECLRVNQFERFIHSILCAHKIQDPLQLYKKPGKRKPDDKLEYHVTAKFCDRKQCLPYQENVQPFLGAKFRLHIVGLFITEKTFGFRVRLTASQKALFDERRNSDVCTKPSEKESISHKDNFKWEDVAKINEVEMNGSRGKDPKCKSDLHKSYPGVDLVRQKEDFHPTESRAHITIGCTPFIKAFQTGEDLVDILDLEMRPAIFHQDFQIHGATLRQFGRNATAFVIYPHHEVIAEAIFNIFR